MAKKLNGKAKDVPSEKPSKGAKRSTAMVLKKVSPVQLEAIRLGIDKKFGEGSISLATKARCGFYPYQVETGSIALNCMLGPVRRLKDGTYQMGGVPGRIFDIWGPEGSGKTTLLLHMIAATQRAGGSAAFVDAEHALDLKYAAACGVNLDELYLSQPSTGEEGLEITRSLIKAGFAMVGVDSVAALIPKAELEGEIGDTNVGLQARMMSQGIRMINNELGPQTPCTVVFLNQIREKIGVMFGNPETTPGGRALKFFSSYRIEVRRGDPIKLKVAGSDVEQQVGHRVKIKTYKSKSSPPFQNCEASIYYGHGFHAVEELVDLATAAGIIEKSGAWYNLGKTRLGQGRANAVQLLQNDGQIRYQLYDAYLTFYNAARGITPEGEPIPGFISKSGPTLGTEFRPDAPRLSVESQDGEVIDPPEGEDAEDFEFEAEEVKAEK